MRTNAALDYMVEVLEGYAAIPQEEKDRLPEMLKSLHLKKDEFFVRQGDRPSRMALITGGIFRIFCITESGDEKTLAFRTRGQFLAAFTPFVEKRDSWYSIQALMDADLVYIPLDDFIKLSSSHPCWEKVTKEYMVRLFIEKEDRERSFLTEDARTRYLRFREKHPGIERQIHQFHIASFLGISPVSLSRIRAELKNAQKLT